MDKIAVLIPCYNESKTVKKVVEDYRAALPEAVIYVYDNNSTDGTDKLAREAGAVVRYERQQGKGNVIRRMFMEVDAECYLMVDGDDTYPADAARALCDEVLLRQADMAVGDRLSSNYFTENKRPFHNSGNALVCSLVNILFGGKIRDVMTGLRAFSYRFVKTFPVLSHGFEIETEMSIHALDKNMRIQNIAITYRDRPEGSVSKLNTVSDGVKVICTIGRLFRFYRPARYFGILGLVLMLISLAFLLPPCIGFQTEHIPSLIPGALLMISALISFFSGLILQTVCRKNRQDFEMNLHNAMNREKELKQ